jgi:hypothetical protein
MAQMVLPDPLALLALLALLVLPDPLALLALLALLTLMALRPAAR